MAESSRLGHSVKGSDVFYDYNCSVCLNRNGTYSEAVFYCPDCNTYLCRQCYICKHDVIGRHNEDRWGHPSKRAKFDPCQKHKGHLLQLYCRKHDVVCCPACSMSEHKSCGDSVYIPLVANANENKAYFKIVKQEVLGLHLKADQASKDRTTKLTELEQTEKHLVTSVKEFRARIDVLLDNMEKKSIDDIAKFITFFRNRYKSELDICDTIKTEMKDLQNKLDTASTDESLLFSRIKRGNKEVRDKCHLVSDITMFESSVKACFEPYTDMENHLNSLQGLGEMLTDSSTDKPITTGSGRADQSVSHDLESNSAASNKPYRPVYKTSLVLKAKQNKDTCDITGMCMMPNGPCILADGSSCSLMKLSSQNEVTSRCRLTSAPWDVCHTVVDQVAVALVDKHIQLVSVADKMVCLSSFSTIHGCLSLAYSNRCLFITEYAGTAVYVYNLTGAQLRVFTQDQYANQLFSSISRITTSGDGERLHVAEDKGLATIDTRGNLIARFTSGELEGGANAVCADGDGNVFVGGLSSRNVLHVGGEANKRLAEILSPSNGIQVQAICFDGINDRLLVSSYKSDTVHVLHLSY